MGTKELIELIEKAENLLKSNKGQFHPQHDLGNGPWGKIDFLVNHCGSGCPSLIDKM